MVRRSNSYIGISLILFSLLLLSIFSTQALSQSAPSKIRGYKIHKAEVYVSVDPDDLDKKDVGVLVDFEDPVVSGVTLSGVTFDVLASITSFGQSGTIDFVSFENFKINGINIEIADYNESFSLEKGNAITFSSPVKVFINGIQGTKAIFGEIRGSEDQWRITGKALVFGKFRKGIFKFKRVIPVYIDLTVDRPSIKIPYINTK